MRSDLSSQLEYVLVATGILKRQEARWLARRNKLLRNGNSTSVNACLEVGDVLTFRDASYRVIAGGKDRLGLRIENPQFPKIIRGSVRVHCGFHKCLTMYTRKIYRRASIAMMFSAERFRNPPIGFRHYFHRIDAWMEDCVRYGVSSLSGHSLKLDQFKDIRVVRFIRDPRDLVVSGYFYHKRGGEHWCLYKDPSNIDYEVVNGVVPENLPADQSLQGYLNQVSLEEGLKAEIQFRRKHFESMMRWPHKDERVKTYKYEDVIGNEYETFKEILTFFGKPRWIADRAGKDALRYRAGKKEAKKGHVRNPQSQQWRELFSPALKKQFTDTYGDLLARYGYPEF